MGTVTIDLFGMLYNVENMPRRIRKIVTIRKITTEKSARVYRGIGVYRSGASALIYYTTFAASSQVVTSAKIFLMALSRRVGIFLFVQYSLSLCIGA